MDILSHTLSGTAIGTVVASYTNQKNKLWIILTASFGGALPDFDALSLWSKFDKTIGSFLHLSHSGKEIYFGKFWYSHHGALHSLTASLFLPLFFLASVYILKQYKNISYSTVKDYFISNRLLLIGFILGFNLHLLKDMPTPHCIWGGVNYFFPSTNYIGGFGKIWWWNNYDLFLLIISVILINLTVLTIRKFTSFNQSKLCTFIFILAFGLALYQINTRDFDFNYKGHTSKYNQYELQSKKTQKKILGNKLYSLMKKFDNSISLNF